MIEFKNVSKVYNNGTEALRNLSLSIAKGEFVFIVGSSGAGKSTFLKLIMREEVPNSGEIVVNGRKLSTVRKRDVPYLRRTMGIVFQDFRLIDKMTVYEIDIYFQNNKERIKKEILEKKYRPQPGKRVYIPKSNGKKRLLV